MPGATTSPGKQAADKAPERNVDRPIFRRMLSVPEGDGGAAERNTIEVPMSSSPFADTNDLMHPLSNAPSSRDRRGSRNSFGTSLPIPRSKRQSRLSSSINIEDAMAAANIRPEIGRVHV